MVLSGGTRKHLIIFSGCTVLGESLLCVAAIIIPAS